MSNSVIRGIKQSVADELLADPYFSRIPVFVIIPKDIMSEINKGILPVEAGLAVFIENFTADKSDADGGSPWYENGRLTISVVEAPVLNDPTTNADAAGGDCDEASETAQRLLWEFCPEGGRNSCTVSDIAEVESDTFSIRRFHLQLPVGFQPIVKPDMPPIDITPAGGSQEYPLEATMKLRTSVLGAAILFTIDNTFPGPRNPSARIYAGGIGQLNDQTGQQLVDDAGVPLVGPFTIPGPCKLRARAYLVGYNSGAETITSFS